MQEHWKQVCRIRDIPATGAYVVPRGLAWQELPGVALSRTADDAIVALLDSPGLPEEAPRHYRVKVEAGRVYLDLAELNAPASRAEAALAGKTRDRPWF